jgi:uncharacterized protein (TIGR03067 family)
MVLAPIAIADDTDKSEQKALAGTWQPEKAELAGSVWAETLLKTIVLKLEGENYQVSVAGKLDKGQCSYDASAAPKRLTIRGTEGPNAGKTFLCIYEHDGDALRVCYDLSGKQFPTEFATAKDTLLYLVTYKRKAN